jgi:hypothetical protein
VDISGEMGCQNLWSNWWRSRNFSFSNPCFAQVVEQSFAYDLLFPYFLMSLAMFGLFADYCLFGLAFYLAVSHTLFEGQP